MHADLGPPAQLPNTRFMNYTDEVTDRYSNIPAVMQDFYPKLVSSEEKFLFYYLWIPSLAS